MPKRKLEKVKPCSRGGFSGSESSNPFPGLGEPPTFLEAALSVEFEYAFQLGRSPAFVGAARTVESLWHALADLLDRFTPQECANYLANAEYAPLNRNRL
jgi:hypothetical protein